MNTKLVIELEGLVASRLKVALRKAENCGFNTIFTHILCQLTTHDKELKAEDMQEDKTDLQPIQPNSIYIKCAVLESKKDYKGKGNAELIAVRRATVPVMFSLKQKTSGKELESTLPTDSPIEDEYEAFPLVVEKDIVFHTAADRKERGWYNQAANILWICDVTHNPHRAEVLLDRAISAVYELQKCGSLDVISPLYKDAGAGLEKQGFQKVSLMWSGFESDKDNAFIDGTLEAEAFIKASTDELIKAGVDIFSLRSILKTKNCCTISINKNVGKIEFTDSGVQVPSYTTLETEAKTIGEYVTTFTEGIAKTFYEKAKEELKKKKMVTK